MTESPAAETARRRDLLLVAALGLLLYLPAIGNHDLWNPDEPRYAEQAREMVAAGNLMVPLYNGEPDTHKPPLMFWSIAAASMVTGSLDETAARLPSALAAVGTMLLIFASGLRLFGRRVAWLAVLCFVSIPWLLWQGRIGQIDMLLTFLVTLAMHFWLRGWVEDRPAFYRLFFVAAGLGTLAKGPPALLVPLLAIVAFLAIERDRDELRRLRVGSGLAIWAAVVLAWLVPAGVVAGKAWFHEIAVTQTLVRFFSPMDLPVEMTGHLKPWYYFLIIVPEGLVPWAWLFPSALRIGWSELGGRDRERLLFLVCWVAMTVLFFSLSPAKRSVYVLIMVPALLLVVAVGIDRALESWPRFRRWIVLPLAILVLALAGLAAWIASNGATISGLEAMGPEFVRLLVIGVGVLALLVAVGVAIVCLGRACLGLGTVAASMTLATMIGVLVLVPRFEPVKSDRPMAEILMERKSPEDPYAFYGRQDAGFLFYTRQFAPLINNPEDLTSYLHENDPAWLLVERGYLGEIDESLGLIEEARDRDSKRGFVLFRSP